MTIIRTKPSSENKGDKLELPLVEEGGISPSAPHDDSLDGEFNEVDIRHAKRISTATVLCILLTALTVVGLGILCGMYVHREYLRVDIFKGWCGIPMSSQYLKNGDADYMIRQIDPNSDFLVGEDSEQRFLMNDDDDDDDDLTEDVDMEKMLNGEMHNQLMKDFFQEQFEIDLLTEAYEKIDVPDFRDDRAGRFIHDFSTNTTGIIDVAARRCFVMPLDRATVLPPKSLHDLISKMWAGYYSVDTRVLRESMMVMLPPMGLGGEQDVKEEVGDNIDKECGGWPIYRLEKYVGGVVKRSVDLSPEAKFAAFSGRGIVELDLVNYGDVQRYEATLPRH